MARLRRRREQGRQEGSVQPGRRDLRRRAVPEGSGLRAGRPARDLRLQPRRLVRRLGPAPRHAHQADARRPRRLPSPVSPRPASPSPHARATRTTSPSSRPSSASSAARTRRASSRDRARGAASTSSPARAHRSSPSTTGSSRRSAATPSSGATSSSRTSTATASPTRTSARSRRPTPCRSRTRATSSTPARSPRTTRSRARPASAGRQLDTSDTVSGDKQEKAAVEPRADHPAEGAPVRASEPPELAQRRRRGPDPQLEGQARWLHHLPQLLLARVRPEREGCPPEDPPEGLAGDRRHDPRPHRPHGRGQGLARLLRDPPGRPRRPADRPEADPRRLEAARGDGDLPRCRQECPVRRATARRSARSC